MSDNQRNNVTWLVVMELLSLLLFITLARNLLVPESSGLTSVAVLFAILAVTSYVVGEFETPARGSFGLTLRTQAAFGMTYVAYSGLHAIWPWCEQMTVRFWLVTWAYLSLLAPFVGMAIRRIARQPALLVTDINAHRAGLLRWWGFECTEVIPLGDLPDWLQANADDHGRIPRYHTIIIDAVDPRTEYAVAGLSQDYFVDFVGIPAFRMASYIFGPHPRPVASYALNGINRRLKRIVDLVLSALAIVVLGPLLLAVSIIIKLDSPGPVFFPHRRLGRNMRDLFVLKFRTMHKDAAQRLKDLLDSDPELKREFETNFKLKNDPRVTRVGKYLRKYSIDELPQFFNILWGGMSFVGPRPIVEGEVKYYKDYSLLMFRVPPGATGLWQVSGRSETSYDTRVELDTRYVQQWTFWDDIKIILKTIPAVLSRRGAY
jgi:lipopolysaccharide/colanic/teichoic acid biosynthesis glycosyltransferase